MSNSSRSPQRENRLSDSPWFWMALFAASGLALLVAIGPKYSKRQAIIENKYRAREAASHARAAPDNGEQTDGAAPTETAGVRGQPGELLIPLEPLVLLTSLLLFASLTALAWPRWRHRLNKDKNSPEDPR